MSRFCTNCGKELQDGAAFCDGCGAPIGGQSGGQGYQPEQPYEAQDKPQKTKRQLPLVIGIIAVVLVLYVIISSISGSRNSGSYQDRWSDMMDKGYITIEEK